VNHKQHQLGSRQLHTGTHEWPRTHTYTHTCLRVEFLGGGSGSVGPGDVVSAKVVGAVGGVPSVVAVGPGQGGGQGGVEVEQSPGDDGVVVEGHVQCDDADGVADT